MLAKMKRRGLALFVAMVMVLGMLPTAALADELDNGGTGMETIVVTPETPSPESTDEVAPPESTDEVAPPESTEEVVTPPESTDEVAPPEGTDEVAPPEDTDEVTPPESTEIPAPEVPMAPVPAEDTLEYAVVDTATEDGAVITVSGLLPQGAYVDAYPVEITLEDLTVLAAYDITIYNGDGNVWQPDASVTVDITLPEPILAGVGEVEIYHMEDMDAAQADQVEALEFHEDAVTFEASSFSIYCIVPSKPCDMPDDDEIKDILNGNSCIWVKLDCDCEDFEDVCHRWDEHPDCDGKASWAGIFDDEATTDYGVFQLLSDSYEIIDKDLEWNGTLQVKIKVYSEKYIAEYNEKLAQNDYPAHGPEEKAKEHDGKDEWEIETVTLSKGRKGWYVCEGKEFDFDTVCSGEIAPTKNEVPVRFYLEGASGDENYTFTDQWASLESVLKSGWANVGSAGPLTMDFYNNCHVQVGSNVVTGDAAVRAWLEAQTLTAPFDMDKIGSTLADLVAQGLLSKGDVAGTVNGEPVTVGAVIADPNAYSFEYTAVQKNHDVITEYFGGNGSKREGQASFHVHLKLVAAPEPEIPMGSLTIQKTFEIDSGLDSEAIMSRDHFSIQVKDSQNTVVATLWAAYDVQGINYQIKEGSNVTLTSSSGQNGVFSWTLNVPVGSYTVEETYTEDNGYTVTASPDVSQEANVAKGEMATVNFTNKYERLFVSFTLKKVDSEDNSKTLPGAQFTIYQDEDCTDVATDVGENGVVTTGENGTVEVKLPVGRTYYMKETKAPEGYKITDEKIYKLATVGNDIHEPTGVLDKIAHMFDGKDVTSENYQSGVLTVENDRAYGTLKVSKIVAGLPTVTGVPENYDVTITVTPKDGTDPLYTLTGLEDGNDATITAQPGTEGKYFYWEIKNVPAGEYVVKETSWSDNFVIGDYEYGLNETEMTNDGNVTVTADVEAWVAVTNTYGRETPGIDPNEGLYFSKSVDAKFASVGDTLTYTIQVHNAGEQAAEVTITDVLADGLTYVGTTPSAMYAEETRTVSWTGEIPADTTFELQITATINADQAGKTITNTAAVNGEDTNEVFTVIENDLAYGTLKVSKIVAGLPTVTGVPENYDVTITVTPKDGTDPLYTLTGLEDGNDATITAQPGTEGKYFYWEIKNVPAGEYVVKETSWSDNFVIGDYKYGLNETEMTNDGNVTVTADAEAWVAVTNTYGRETPGIDPNEGLYFSKSVDAKFASVGDTLTYTIQVHNAGEQATEVTITDVLADGLTYVGTTPSATYAEEARTVSWTGEIPADTTFELQITATINADQAGKTITNTAAVNGEDTNEVFTVVDSVVPPVPAPELTIIKTADVSSVTVGGSITYTITVTNDGNAEATNVKITDTLPSGVTYSSSTEGGSYDAGIRTITWEVGTLAAGESRSVAVTVTADTVGTPVNTAAVDCSELDPVEDDASVTVQSGTTPVDPGDGGGDDGYDDEDDNGNSGGGGTGDGGSTGGETNIPDGDVPQGGQPGGETDIPDGDVPQGSTPDVPETTDDPAEIVDGDVPMGNLPQTGTMATPANPTITLGMLAMSASLAAAGLAITISRKREEDFLD